MKKAADYHSLLQRVEETTKQKGLDLSSGEDLSIGIMNLISIEEHLFYTFNKTKDDKYLDLLDEIRKMRTDLMKEIIKDYEGEVWCISKHLLAASMRIMEVGTKELKKGEKQKAKILFQKSYQLYSLFWGINLGVVSKKDITAKKSDEIEFTGTDGQPLNHISAFSKLGAVLQKALDCCRE